MLPAFLIPDSLLKRLILLWKTMKTTKITTTTTTDNDNKVIYEREGYTPVLVENGSTEPSNIDDMVYGE